MAVYRNDPAGFQEIQRRSLRFTIPILVVVVVYIVVLSNKNPGMSLQGDLVAFSLLLPAWWVGHYIGLKKQREIFLSYELTITPEYIERVQKKTPTIRINRADVQRIVIRRGGGMFIQSGATSDQILISKHIENADALAKELAEIVTPVSSFNQADESQRLIPPVLGIAGAVALGTTFLADAKWVVVPSAVVAIVVLAYSLVAIVRNRNVDSRTKLLAYGSVVLIAALLFVIYNKLTS